MHFYLICAGIGVAMGLLAGFLGVGGGIIAIPAMVYFLNMDVKLAMGTSLAVIVPVATMGAFKQFQQHQVDLRVGICIAVCGVLFAYVGAWLNKSVDALWLHRIFAVFLLVMGAKMLLEKPPAKPEEPAPAATAALAETTQRPR